MMGSPRQLVQDTEKGEEGAVVCRRAHFWWLTPVSSLSCPGFWQTQAQPSPQKSPEEPEGFQRWFHVGVLNMPEPEGAVYLQSQPRARSPRDASSRSH